MNTSPIASELEVETSVDNNSPARARRHLGLFLLAGDAGIIAGSSLAAYALRDALGKVTALDPFKNEVPIALAVLPLWLAIFYAFGCYRLEYLNAGGDVLRRFASGCVGGLLALGFVSFIFNLSLARIYVAVLFLLVIIFGGLLRVGVRKFLKRRHTQGRLITSVLIAGADAEAVALAEAIGADGLAGYRVIGFLSDEMPVGTEVSKGVKVVGSIASAREQVLSLGAGMVIVSPTDVPPGTLADLTVFLEGLGVDLAIAPSLFEVVTRRVTVENVANVPILHVNEIRIDGIRAVAKRAVDIAGSILLLVLLWPVMLATALAIRIVDGPPVLFEQVRVGKDGSEFLLRKFRTMQVDAEDQKTDIKELNEAGDHLFKVRNDPRVTRLGNFLRRWSLDELPQLWNVLIGEMSLIGPRPPLPDEVSKYDSWQLRRLRARPGISGYWQVSGRSEIPFDEAVRLDLFYIANWSLSFDLYLIARTVRAVLSRRGAY